MKKRPTNLLLGLGLVVLLALGSVQGNRLDRIGDSEVFYRWLVNAATQMRIDGTLEYYDSARATEPVDDRFYARVEAFAEAHLPEITPDSREDFTADGEVHSKLIRAARAEEDQAIWRLARHSDVSELKSEFLQLRSEGRLQSVGTELSATALYGQGEDNYTVGVSSLFFGFRKVAANFLWLEVDKYWHTGQMHRMVPLMRTVVTLDPSFVDAYLLGSWHLAYNITAKLPVTPEPLKKYHPKYDKRLGVREEWYYIGADFLKDGIRNNPRDYRLYFDLGYAIYDEKLKDYPNAVRYLREATRHRHDRWVPRRLNIALMHNEQYEEAIDGWNRYLAQFPDNLVAPRFIQYNEAYLAEAISEEARECADAAELAAAEARSAAEEARAAGDGVRAAEYEAEAERAASEAREMQELSEVQHFLATAIWTELAQADEGETLAAARLLRLEALQLVEQGSHREAVAVLQEARWKSAQIFEEANEMIIDIKQSANIPLTVSERMAVEREHQADLFRDGPEQPPIRRLDCTYRDRYLEDTAGV